MEPEVTTVLGRVPEFAGRYRSLVRAADGDPGAAVVFEDLAEFVGVLLGLVDRAEPCLTELMRAVEQVAATSPEAEELVGGAFLDNLSPDQLRRLTWCMGRRTRAILDELELPPAATGGDGAG